MGKRAGFFAVLAIALSAVPAWAGEPGAPNVVELFTSQSCSSCPPAEAYLGRLAARPDIVALEYHVDYWNDLVYGLAGRWKDVHSSAAFTERQRAYARHLPGGVYTPQMVIDGRLQAVGSRVRDVETALAEARAAPRLSVRLTTRSAGKTELRVSGPQALMNAPAEVVLVRFKQRVETRVRSGENRGKSLVNHHIVTDSVSLGPLARAVSDGEPIVFDDVTAVSDEGCAILVQVIRGGGLGPILGAALCPGASRKAP